MTRPAPESDVEPAKALDEIAEQWLCSDVSGSARSITQMHQNMRRSLRAALQKAYDLGRTESAPTSKPKILLD
jgi:hypothetical protein